MYYVRLFTLYLGLASALFLLIGLYKPWTMLWWEDVQNRKKVIKVYGMSAVIFLVTYYALGFFP